MRKFKPTTCLFTLLLIAIVCLGLAFLSGYVLGIPNQAAQIFGEPTPKLSLTQQIFLSWKLLKDKDKLIYPTNNTVIPVTFTVTLGEPPPTIASNLENSQLIPDRNAFLDFLVYAGLDTTLQAGEYQLNTSMTPIEIAYALQDATPKEVSLNILPGLRLDEIAAAIPTSGLAFTPNEFLEIASTPPEDIQISLGIPPGKPLEGFLFPDSYRVPRETTANQLISQIVSNFNIKVNQELQDGFSRQGLSLYQAVILASIVEKETIVDEEMPLIASVFLNRLKAQIKLDSDPTVQYAIGYDAASGSWWKNPLTADDLKIDSPYNTYLYPGLPPTPIASPSLNALRAVAFPATTPYYYFRAACDGSGRHSFSETFEEHLNKACP